MGQCLGFHGFNGKDIEFDIEADGSIVITVSDYHREQRITIDIEKTFALELRNLLNKQLPVAD